MPHPPRDGGQPLLTFEVVARLLWVDVDAVLQLILARSLLVEERDGGLIVTADSLQTYLASLLHPPDVLAYQRHARRILADLHVSQLTYPVSAAELAALPPSSYLVHMAQVAPYLRTVSDAVDAGAYDVARAAWWDIWRLVTDFNMRYAPLNAGDKA
ncbi:hypothetical protein [uncultured Deinococcus sp.]|uniref:hypothetical protein n=1 Tax=uncultured Deinococcus sp. TaxID=158789 RepID=UPI0025F54459|nr:hypothetical protein [uncultured Deinococcus sp.]